MIDQEDKNAFVLPSGNIFVFTGNYDKFTIFIIYVYQSRILNFHKLHIIYYKNIILSWHKTRENIKKTQNGFRDPFGEQLINVEKVI